MKLRAFVLMLVIVSGPLLVRAQENKQSFVEWLVEDNVLEHQLHPMHPMLVMEQSFPAKQVDSSIDVISYDVYADWYMALLTPRDMRPERKATGRVKAVVKSRINDLKSVVFDGSSMAFDSVTSGGSRITFTKNAFSITMNLPKPLQRGQEVELTIYYANLRDRGAIFIWSKADANAVNVPYASGYTISEPEDARKWYPCNDQPDDKALFTSHMRVPKGFTFVSNGVQFESVADGDTAVIQSRRLDVPMSTYLFSMNASEYVEYPQTYTRSDNSTVPISSYQFGIDVDGAVLNAKNAYSNLPLMFAALEEKLGKYPFPTYGQVAVDPFQYGGMEHQSMTTVNRIWLNGNSESGVAHELTHHWFGDKVTCGTWGDIWLNEGGATWGEALYAESRSGAGGYLAAMWSKRGDYMAKGLDEPPVYDIPLSNIFNQPTTYAKASWVYHMMRTLVGDDLIFPALRGYLAKYAQSSAQTFQLLDHLKSTILNLPVSWDVFFDQWLVK
ncbi:MAG: M1 family metallopeptidase, partial [Candidatus Kapabacteria bacterium]|nr:M1 family metallopeptidase [Candidatus Kapabacteria bacterium]